MKAAPPPSFSVPQGLRRRRGRLRLHHGGRMSFIVCRDVTTPGVAGFRADSQSVLEPPRAVSGIKEKFGRVSLTPQEATNNQQ
jgi:hypothetical protein